MLVVIAFFADGVKSRDEFRLRQNCLSLKLRSKFKLHPVVRNFPSRLARRAVRFALFVQQRICIVHVDKDAPPTARRFPSA